MVNTIIENYVRQKRLTMNYDLYIDLIAADKLKEATEYKNSCIPDVLYKYYWLDDNEEKNERRLNTLAEGKVYMSSLGGFNDLFEGQAFVFDENELRDKGWNLKWFKDFVEQINSNAGVGCFCVEYLIDRKVKKFMYPVSYEDTRAPGNAIIGNIIDQTLELIKDGKGEDDMSGELNALNHMAYLSLTSKHKSWKHEKEVRALVPRCYGEYLELLPRKIFIGINCREVHKERLIEIAKNFQPYCEVFQMKNIANSLNHWLVEEKINIDN